MARKAAEKKESSKKTHVKASVNKGTGKRRTVKKNGAKKSTNNRNNDKNLTLKAIKALVTKGKKQGYLTYDEINEMLPKDMLCW